MREKIAARGEEKLFNVLCLSSGAVAEGSRFKVRTGETKGARGEGDRGCGYAYKRGWGMPGRTALTFHISPFTELICLTPVTPVRDMFSHCGKYIVHKYFCGKRANGVRSFILQMWVWAICFPLPKARTSVDGAMGSCSGQHPRRYHNLRQNNHGPAYRASR